MAGLKRSQHLKLKLKDIQEATENFKTCIGNGGFGMVYKGELIMNGKHSTVAAKKLCGRYGHGIKEFLNEIDLLTGQQHPNVISLLGYCDEDEEKIIVYEYAERGSLDRYIRRCDSSSPLAWLKRLEICADAARGLDHLHRHAGKHQAIIHRDIKSANILLDENWIAKISDLGLSKLSLVGLDRSGVISNPCGTPGYWEPEYVISGILKKESDIYSFGIVLFEVMCGRLCRITDYDGFILSAKLAKEHCEQKKLDEIIDPRIREEMSPSSLNKFSALAYECLHDDRAQRPSMEVVTKVLEEILKIQVGLKRSQYLKLELKDIKEATKNFEKSIGKGGFGEVYLGEITYNDKPKKVAVKRLGRGSQGPKEFLNEIDLLTGQEHPNIISLIGYCDEHDEKIIVYEYAKNGSLDCYIRCGHDESTCNILSWVKRLKICVDAARGLDHLHRHIIHRDIKSSNILLDENWIAKISDFGLSKLIYVDRSGVITNPCGTPGYCEPEYYDTGIVKKESDIFSFGLVLFEVMCGRLCTTREKDGLRLSHNLAKKYYQKDLLDAIIDPHLREQMCPSSLEKFSKLAYECLNNERAHRPTMDEVTKELEEALKIQEEYDSWKKEEEYWKTKLPDDSEEILERLNPPVKQYSTRKELFMLLHRGFFFDDSERAPNPKTYSWSHTNSPVATTTDQTISSVIQTLSENPQLHSNHVITLLSQISLFRPHYSATVTAVLRSISFNHPDIPPRAAALALSTLVSLPPAYDFDLIPAYSETTEGLFLSLCFGLSVPVRHRLLLDAGRFDVRPSILLTVFLGFTKDPYPYVRKAALDGLCNRVVFKDGGMIKGCYLRGVELLSDTEDCVRCSAVRMVCELGKLVVEISEDKSKFDMQISCLITNPPSFMD
ncbi:hypothetical protein R6Q59_027191 [Mikania micrantha]